MRTWAIEVRWDGAVVAGITRISPLRRSVEVIAVHDGLTGGVRGLPGRGALSVLTLERELGDDVALDLWAGGPQLRKSVELRLTDASDGLSVTFRLHGCWVSGYDVTPDLTTGSVLESLTLSVDAWERVTGAPTALAERLAADRHGVVRRIDLGALLTGRPDETARGLEAVLAQAEADGATLLLDEADALFARRTEVASTDRYEATELDAVLDRLSHYSGSVVVVPPDGT